MFLLQVAARMVEREERLPQPPSRPRAGFGDKPLAGLLVSIRHGLGLASDPSFDTALLRALAEDDPIPVHSMTTREHVAVGSMLQRTTSNSMCLAVAVAIPALLLLAYCFDSPDAGRQGSGKGQAPCPIGAPDTESSLVYSRRAAALSAQGLSLGIPRALLPWAQEARADIADLGTDTTFLKVMVSERSSNPGIWLLASDRVPVGFLDTSQALLDPRAEGPTPGQESRRCVVFHRSPNNQGSLVPASWRSECSMHRSPDASKQSGPLDPDAPFAVFVLNRTPAGGQLVAQRCANAGSGQKSRSKLLLTVNMDAYGQVMTVNDRAGVMLATTDPAGTVYSPSGHGPGSARIVTERRGAHASHTVITLSLDADVVLIAAAVLSAQKLQSYFVV